MGEWKRGTTEGEGGRDGQTESKMQRLGMIKRLEQSRVEKGKREREGRGEGKEKQEQGRGGERGMKRKYRHHTHLPV